MENDKKRLSNLNVIKEYTNVMVDGLKNSFPDLHESEIREAINWSIMKRYYNGPASLNNNYTHKKLDGTILDILQYIESLEPIITSSGVLFKQHKKSVNPMSKMIMGFIEQRAKYKKEMFKYPKGSEMFNKYNLAQLLEKLNANATYGVLGAPTSMLYNLYVAEAVTRQGRSYISCSIMLFESLLSNNVKFNNLNEVITFINNIQHEKDNRMLLDDSILDRNITIEECFFKIMNTADMAIWIPTEKEMCLVWDYLLGLSQEDINRIYYKNNLYNFCELPIVMDLIIKILCSLKEPFMNPNKPPKYIIKDLDTLVTMIKEYVYYPHFYIDKLDRIEYMQRDIVCVSDTDSTIISFDAWYRFILDKVYNIDMPLKHEKFSMVEIIKRDEFGDLPKRVMCEIVEPEFDYNFYTDEVIEVQRLIEPAKIIPQDSLKYSIINIIAYICSDLIVDYLNEYTKLTGSYVDGVKCRMIMKNEFYFLRAMLTSNRRNYADIQVLQEGNIIPEKERMAIMGLPINKSTLSDSVKSKLKDILYEEILTADKIDQIKIIKRLAIFEKEIFNNIMSKKTDYYKPDNIASLSSYADPMRINGIIAAMVYNELRDKDMPAINLDERNKIIKIKLNVSKKNVYLIQDKYPEIYKKLVALLNHPTLGAKVNTIALPVDTPVPDWVLEFVDIQSIVSDALKNFPLESVGLKRLDNDSANYTNIIKL
jgi:hypothetical protein